jgi:hypothetical protein
MVIGMEKTLPILVLIELKQKTHPRIGLVQGRANGMLRVVVQRLGDNNA